MHHHYIDRFAQGGSPVHRLDPLAKLLAVLAYTVVVISFGRHDVLPLAPLIVVPLAMLWFAGVPTAWALRRVAVLSPFILMVAIMAVLYDAAPRTLAVGPWQWSIRGGVVAAVSISVKFTLTVLALTALVCTTPFAALLEALQRLRTPRTFTTVLGLLYRYLYVLMGESMRLRRARDFRGGRLATAGRRLTTVGAMIGSLFARTLERSERIHLAMQSRGWTGRSHSLLQHRFGWIDGAFLLVAAAYLLACRWPLAAAMGGGL
jgi:cobalt/nickel transport system permease protein